MNMADQEFTKGNVGSANKWSKMAEKSYGNGIKINLYQQGQALFKHGEDVLKYIPHE